MNKNKYKAGLGRKGIVTMKLENFVDRYEWQLRDYKDSPQKIITTIPLKDYFALGKFCIENKITIAGFVRESIKEKINEKCVKRFRRNMNKTVKIVKKQGEHLQRSLFEDSI